MKHLRALAMVGIPVALVTGLATTASGASNGSKPQSNPAAVSLAGTTTVVESAWVPVAPGQLQTAGYPCPAGLNPTGGGGAFAAFAGPLYGSYPNGKYWYVQVKNTSNAWQSFKVYVVCA
ncbi:hypothetical protein ACFYW6_40470 [Streptomyces sp. NPDC002659]|uniref:hypothetical protein n=1 Tax=Streptomyces sp. NPDC002659 TaxID=3364656 RepID=UPI0036CBEBE1